MTGLAGKALAEAALRVFRRHEALYPSGIRIEELEYHCRIDGVAIRSDNFLTALRSALNASQVDGLWRLVDEGLWLPGDGVSKSRSGLSGRALAEALHAFTRATYPKREFH